MSISNLMELRMNRVHDTLTARHKGITSLRQMCKTLFCLRLKCYQLRLNSSRVYIRWHQRHEGPGASPRMQLTYISNI